MCGAYARADSDFLRQLEVLRDFLLKWEVLKRSSRAVLIDRETCPLYASTKPSFSYKFYRNIYRAVIPAGKHPFPFRTRKLSPPGPMILSPRGDGKVGHSPAFLFFGNWSVEGRANGLVNRPFGPSPASPSVPLFSRSPSPQRT